MTFLACFRQFNWLCIYLGVILLSVMDLIHFSLNSKLKIEFEFHAKIRSFTNTIFYSLQTYNSQYQFGIFRLFRGWKVIVQFIKSKWINIIIQYSFRREGFSSTLSTPPNINIYNNCDVMPCHWTSGFDLLALLFSELIIIYQRR